MTKIAVITGASDGIGHALTLELVSRGIKVIAIGRNSEKLAKLKTSSPDTIQTIVADIATKEGRSAILKEVQDSKIHYLINNAGIITPIGPLQTLPESDIEKLFSINLMAPVFLTNKLLPLFDDAGGRILNVTSVAGNEAVPGIGAYCISKAALNMWTHVLQKELLAKILVADVIPGEVATGMQRDLREAPLEKFPLASEFKEAAQKDTLISPQACAEFLADVLLNTTPEEFVKTWNIYQDSKKPVTQPLNKNKLAEEKNPPTAKVSGFSITSRPKKRPHALVENESSITKVAVLNK